MELPVYVIASNIISPLGFTSEENFNQVQKGECGVRLHSLNRYRDTAIWASFLSDKQEESLRNKSGSGNNFTKFERMLITSATDAISRSKTDPSSNRTVFICSTTKGNILELEESESKTPESDQLELFASAQKLRNYFSNPNDPVMISNACISGLAAVIVAKRMLQSGNYDHAVVVGADTMNRFVFSGFESFQALSQGRCKPFSADRDGINLGEAAATLVLSTSVPEDYSDIPVRVLGGSMSNDANHISGPSRTGEELGMAIQKALKESELTATDIDFISAHGTATVFNDEMEAKAVRLAGLQDVPLNSMKAYFGHTLGAAGLVESVISIESLRKNMIVATAGYSTEPMENTVNVCSENISKELNNCIKIASGFGGCNAALIYSKN